MKLDILNGLGSRQQLDCTRLILRDNSGNPLVIAIQYGPELLQILRAGDRNWETELAKLGATAAIITEVTQAEIKQVTQIPLTY